MNSRQLILRLEREGWQRSGGKDDHVKLKHPARALHVVVPHPRKDIRLGTLRSIYRQAGWPWKDE